MDKQTNKQTNKQIPPLLLLRTIHHHRFVILLSILLTLAGGLLLVPKQIFAFGGTCPAPHDTCTRTCSGSCTYWKCESSGNKPYNSLPLIIFAPLDTQCVGPSTTIFTIPTPFTNPTTGATQTLNKLPDVVNGGFNQCNSYTLPILTFAACCGNGTCNPAVGENCNNCPGDCGPCCGNGLCDFGEHCATCFVDCNGGCPAGQCNQGSCGPGFCEQW